MLSFASVYTAIAVGKQASHKTDEKAARKAALIFQRAERQRERERRHEELVRAKEQQRRRRAIGKVAIAFERAKRAHEKRISMIEVERAALDRRSAAEETLWKKQKEKLERVACAARVMRIG
jgi:colicin import membrane protein